MASRLPLVIISGQLQQLPAGDTISGATASVTFSQVEIDFGATPTQQKSFALSDATVAATSKISSWQAGEAATGRQADENEMDQLLLQARATGVGTWALYATASDRAPLTGKYKINYLVG